MKHLQKLINILKQARTLFDLERNDFSRSSWKDQNHAISESDSIIVALETGSLPDFRGLFAPTGPIQEVSLSSGWAQEFLDLAEQFDKEYENGKSGS